MIPKQSVTHLAVDTLVSHEKNIRRYLSDLDELAASIRASGIIQPIIVTEHPSLEGKWLILAGHRRTAAAKNVGLRKVPAIIRHDVTDIADHLSLMLVENCQRSNLGPVEKSEAVRELMSLGLTQADVARTTGIHPATVNALLLITELDDESIEAVRSGRITAGAARQAVRRQRAESRERLGAPERGRPIQVDPPHLTRSHPLAPTVRLLCDHSTRPKVGDTGCGQCWEQVIRQDTANHPSERGQA